MPEGRNYDSELPPDVKAILMGEQEFDIKTYGEASELIYKIVHGKDYSRDKECGEDWSEERLADFRKVLTEKREIISRALDQRFVVDAALHRLTELADLSRWKMEAPEEIKRLSAFAIDIIAERQERIEEVIDNSGASLSAQWGLRALNILATQGVEWQRAGGVDGLARHTALLGEVLRDEERYHGAASYIGTLLSQGNKEQVHAAAQVVIDVLNEKSDGKQVPRLASLFFEKEKDVSFLRLLGVSLVESLVERHGLPGRKVVDAWMVSAKDHDDAVFRNLECIREVEATQPGTCAFLYQEFGIADFGRYPPEMLIRQREEAADISKPYGVIIFPRSDWNGAFYSNRYPLAELFKTTDGQFSLRIVECGTKYDVGRALYDLDKRYNPPDGSGHKISLAIIGGHGTKDTIRFGGYDRRHLLHTGDLARKRVQEMGSFFEKNLTIILASCSTGADKGIGQELSKTFGAKVIAPKVPTEILAYHASKRRGGKWRFNVNYMRESKDPKDVHTTYIGGAAKQHGSLHGRPPES